MPSLSPERERGLHLAAPSRLALDQGQERQAEHKQPMATDEMESEMGENAAEVQRGARRGVGVEAELDDDTEIAVTPDLQAVAPHYPKAQR
ncbi:MAG: hypothetical protein ALECFALPRED_009290 [Alectoria fallacina]|uniref:Uncharacterized protein n=1 Tax=Alectoria fallacina TaxID=1903189 RepID=A0A8H3EV66_9LECA|nr:MAG: hypothetical protein ALECFALPRED_009290 [Alectoria fallacina]